MSGTLRAADLRSSSDEAVEDRALDAPEARPARDTWFVWAGLFVLIVGASFVFASLDRYMEWDEAVFFSQSGGYEDSGTTPLAMAPSREFGPAALIALFRSIGLSFGEVRTAWMLFTITLLVYAFRGVERHFGRIAAVVGVLFYATFWLFFVYVGSFYGSMLAGLFGLIAVVAYLDLRTGYGNQYYAGVVLGLALSGGFAMRHVESGLLIIVLLGHSLLVRPSAFWSRRGGVAAAAATLLVAFVLPWVAYSYVEYGGVSDRLAALRSQVGGKGGVGWALAIDDYIGVLGGSLQRNTPFTRIPRWPGVTMAVSAVGFVAVAAVALVWRRTPVVRSHQLRGAGLIAAIALTNLGFFALVYASVEIRDRYMTTGLVYVAVLVGALLSWMIHARGTSRTFVSLAVLAGVVWLTAQVGLVLPYESNRHAAGESTRRVAQAVRVLAESAECYGIARYGAPELQIASGCTVFAASSEEGAFEWVAELSEAPVPVFIVWPGTVEEALPLGPEWQGASIPLGRQPRALYYRLP